MRHVFIETNWVFGCVAPGHHRLLNALALLDRSRAGEVQLHLPSPRLTEARRAILTECQRGLEIFAPSEEMLDRTISLSASDLFLQPFDQAILASILVRAEELLAAGETDLCFCEIDSDLQPWDREGNLKQPLARLYDAARVWVYGNFEMDDQDRPENWPE